MIKQGVHRLFGLFGYQLVNMRADGFPVEATDADRGIRAEVMPYTMTSHHRLWALLSATKYVTSRGILGDFVECGVWRGGSAMAMALKLMEGGETGRKIWLYDTFSGMTPPTDEDVETGSGTPASELLSKRRRAEGDNVWCIASREDVLSNVKRTGYPLERFRFVEGDVVETLKDQIPERISLLRLDTDWYESTKAELERLFPLLEIGGVCIVDDYGHWGGARKAVDEFFSKYDVRVLMHRVDSTGRMFIKI